MSLPRCLKVGIDHISKIAMSAPMACNSQPWEFIMVTEPDQIRTPNDLAVLDEVAILTAGDVPDFEAVRARYEDRRALPPGWFVDELCQWGNGGRGSPLDPVHLDSEDSPSDGGIFCFPRL